MNLYHLVVWSAVGLLMWLMLAVVVHLLAAATAVGG